MSVPLLSVSHWHAQLLLLTTPLLPLIFNSAACINAPSLQCQTRYPSTWSGCLLTSCQLLSTPTFRGSATTWRMIFPTCALFAHHDYSNAPLLAANAATTSQCTMFTHYPITTFTPFSSPYATPGSMTTFSSWRSSTSGSPPCSGSANLSGRMHYRYNHTPPSLCITQ
jgi:hypothetical protein